MEERLDVSEFGLFLRVGASSITTHPLFVAISKIPESSRGSEEETLTKHWGLFDSTVTAGTADN